MDVQWTKDQQEVIDTRGVNLLVSAAAGSGKTAVLVERIIRRITEGEHPLDIDRMLVMTFTRSAAAEIRERIAEAIEKKIEENPGDHHLEQQAVLVQYAQITTIDSFCLHLIHQYSDRLDIDPAFRIADTTEIELMKDDVLNELFEECYETWGERFTNVVEKYCTGNTDSNLKDLVLKIWTFAQSNPWPEEWMNECRAELSATKIGDLAETRWMRFLMRDVRMQLEDWIGDMEYALDICLEPDGPLPYEASVRKDLEFYRAMQLAKDFAELWQRAGYSYPDIGRISGKMKDQVDADKQERVKGIRTACKKGMQTLQKDYFSQTPEAMLRDLEEGKEEILTLLDVVSAFSERLAEKKKEKNVVDFGDLEHFALDILGSGENRTPGPEADEMAHEFDEILVDEYQDSNLVQEQLIQYLSRERFGEPDVVMVGDVKQSIYRFRLARPDIFLGKYLTFGADGKNGNRMIELHQNFRSRREVLDATNDIFRRIMTPAVGGIDYNEDAALHLGAGFAEKPVTDSYPQTAELLIMDPDPEGMSEEYTDDAADAEEDDSDYTSRELEAGMVAGKILELTHPDTGLTVWDKTEKCYRTAKYSDIVILLRAKTGWSEDFVEILGRHGIPAIAEISTGFFDTMEVSTVLSLLRVIDNPIQDIPLAAVLRAPFAGLTNQELALIVAENKERTDAGKRGEGLYGAVKNFIVRYGAENPAGGIMSSEILSVNPAFGSENRTESGIILPDSAVSRQVSDRKLHETARKLQSVLHLVHRLQKIAPEISLDVLLHRIYDETGFYLYASAMPGGDTRRANLDMLIEKAKEYESTSYRGVFHFIRYIEKLRKTELDFGGAGGLEASDCVRIMSIHGSKGLEFPVVFVSGLAKNFNLRDTSDKILVDAEMGIGSDFIDAETRLTGPTLKKTVMKRSAKVETLGEELRILYVAMTRAKEKLILTGTMKKAKETADELMNAKLSPSLLIAQKSYLKWILMASGEGHPNLQISFDSPRGQLGREMDEQRGRMEDRAFIESLTPDTVWDADYRALLERAGQMTYPYSSETNLNAKYSVSELRSREQDSEEIIPTVPQFMQDPKDSTGPVRGTAYHRVLSLIRFERIVELEDVKAEIAEILRKEQMEIEDAKLVNPEDILKFVRSALGKRVAKAAADGKLYREQPFVMGVPAREIGVGDSDERVLIQGIVDAFFEEDGELVLLDYKTDRTAGAETLKAHYHAQLDLYERALTMSMNLKVKEKYLYSFRIGEIRL